MAHRQAWKWVCLLLFFLLPPSTLTRSRQATTPTEDEIATPSSNNASSSFLWRVHSNPPSYLLGTIHVPYTKVWKHVPDNAKMAFYNSRHVFFELDLSSQTTMSALAACRILPRGQTLSDFLPAAMLRRLRARLRDIRAQFPSWLTQTQRDQGFDAEYLFSAITANWERNRPIWVLLMLSGLTESDVASRGSMVLDLFLATMAKKHGKRVSAIEEVHEQCGPLNSLSLDKVVFALNYTLNLQESSQDMPVVPNGSKHYTTDDLIEQYKRGTFEPDFFKEDTFHMVMFSHEEGVSERDRRMFRDIDNFFQERLINERNRRMAARMIDLLINRPDSYFFAFGAGHFLGRDSLVDMLRKAGFKVEHVGPNEVLDLRVGQTSSNPRRKNLVAGTFDDLSESEKNRALLQFLQYHQQQEKASETDKFEELLMKNRDTLEEAFGDELLPSAEVAPPNLSSEEEEEEHDVEESLRVWYGLNNNKGDVFGGVSSGDRISAAVISLAAYSLLLILLR